MSQKNSVIRNLGILALLLIVILIVVLAVQYSPPSSSGQPISEPDPLGDRAYPPPPGTVDPLLAQTATAESAAELELIPPTSLPATLIPTPAVTAIPVSAPPLTTGGDCPPAGLGTVLFRQGSALMAVEGKGGETLRLVDIQEELGQFLAGDAVGVHASDWISASPDGDQVALVVSSDPGPPEDRKPPIDLDIYLFDRAAGELSLLVENAREPAWSPDGSRIAYLSGPALLVRDLDTGESREIYAADAENEHTLKSLDWSPDGSAIVFVDEVFRQENAIIGVDARTRAVLFQVKHPQYFTYTPRWSPDGTRILYLTSDGVSSSSERFLNLWMMRSDGSNGAQITQDIAVLAGADWSADGEWIVFSGQKAYEPFDGAYDLWLTNPAGSELKRLTASEGASELSPAWSPDCTALYFTVGDAGLRRISLADATQTGIGTSIDTFVVSE